MSTQAATARVMESIARGVLIATPSLRDPNFAKSVILMLEHSRAGALGLVLNRPGRLAVADFLGLHGLTWDGDAGARVGLGGPVMLLSRWILHEPEADPGDDPASHRLVAPGIAVSTSAECLTRLVAKRPRHLRFLMGYAGWGEGQLEGELGEGAWLVGEPTPAIVFESDGVAMWELAVRSLGLESSRLGGSGIS